jgi:predicted MPP superfamily phosphohydrolase
LSLFLTVFFLIYGSLHLYTFLKVKAALSLGFRTIIPLALFMLLMILAPIIVRYLENLGLEFLARLMSYIGYIWMGVLILFFAAALCIDIYKLLIYVIGLIFQKDLSSFTISTKMSFLVPLIFAIAASVYGFFEARDIHVEHLTIRTSKIPKENNSLRIVQISDVHIGLIVREERLKRIIEKVNSADPDILISTGDLVDGQINKLEGLAELLGEIQPQYGKYAITGNHEYYAGLDQALDFTGRAGFTILRGQAVSPGGIINIAGVDDSTGKQFGRFTGAPETKLLSGLDRDKFTLLLKHRPLVDTNALGLYDLQISGHTHKGQLFPFSLITKLYYPKHAGLLNLPQNSQLYVNRGTGTWGPPIRFLSPPEVTVIELVRE